MNWFEGFNFIDFVYLFIIILCVFGGLRSGAARIVLTSVGLVGGIFLSQSMVNIDFRHSMGTTQGNMANFVAYFSMIIFPMIGYVLGGWISHIFPKPTASGGLNAILGILFGFLQGVVVCTIIYHLVYKGYIPWLSDELTTSRFSQQIGTMYQSLIGLLSSTPLAPQ